MTTIRTSYHFGSFPQMDDAVHAAVGRVSDFSGTDFNGRDLGWICKSEIEAERVKRALRKLRLPIR